MSDDEPPDEERNDVAEVEPVVLRSSTKRTPSALMSDDAPSGLLSVEVPPAEERNDVAEVEPVVLRSSMKRTPSEASDLSLGGKGKMRRVPSESDLYGGGGKPYGAGKPMRRVASEQSDLGSLGSFGARSPGRNWVGRSPLRPPIAQVDPTRMISYEAQRTLSDAGIDCHSLRFTVLNYFRGSW